MWSFLFYLLVLFISILPFLKKKGQKSTFEDKNQNEKTRAGKVFGQALRTKEREGDVDGNVIGPFLLETDVYLCCHMHA